MKLTFESKNLSKKTEKTFSFAYKETFLDYIILETL